jgi:hypothetical protein
MLGLRLPFSLSSLPSPFPFFPVCKTYLQKQQDGEEHQRKQHLTRGVADLPFFEQIVATECKRITKPDISKRTANARRQEKT